MDTWTISCLRTHWSLYFESEDEEHFDSLLKESCSDDDRFEMILTFLDYFTQEGQALLPQDALHTSLDNGIMSVSIPLDYCMFIHTCPIESMDQLLHNRPHTVLACLALALILVKLYVFL